MQEEIAIMERIAEFRKNVLLADEKIDGEMQKNHRKRDYKLMRFWYKEKEVYKMGIAQLEWILNNDGPSRAS